MQSLSGDASASGTFLRQQLELLHAHATGTPLEELYELTLKFIESEIDGAHGSIVLANTENRTMTVAAAPRLSDTMVAGIRDAAYGGFGTCARALDTMQPVVVRDMMTDPSWADWRELATELGFISSWSHPFFDVDGELLGTVGLYFRDEREPTPEELDCLSVGSYLIGLFIGQDRAKRSLVDSEERYRKLVEAATDTIAELDPGTGRILYISPSIAELTGLTPDEVIGQPLSSLFHANELQEVEHAVARVLAQDEGTTLEDLEALEEAPTRWLRMTLSHRSMPEFDKGAVAIISDVTPRKQAQIQLRFAERMNTVGTLAAGVAHEINNPLTFISANLAFIAEKLGDGITDEMEEALSDALDGVARVTEIVGQLRTFARADSRSKAPVGLEEVVQSSVKLASLQIPSNVIVSVRIEGEPVVQGNATELSQIIVNLVLNAAQAMDGEPGHIEVVAREGDDTSILEITDDGPGISPEVKARIFEPFFTTKGPEVGTGLGLSIVHGIVKRHGGIIDVRSSPESGTVFEIHLPTSHSSDVASKRDKPKVKQLRILFVDDEKALGDSVARLARPHDVVYLEDGLEALEMLDCDQEFDAIFVDLVMPTISGRELFEAIVERWPGIAPKVHFVTGGAVSVEARRLCETMPERILRKPFGRKELLGFVARHAETA